MWGKQPEEPSHTCKDNLDPGLRLAEWPPNRLPPTVVRGRYDHNQGHRDSLPSISPYSTDCYPQYTPSATAHSHNASSYRSIEHSHSASSYRSIDPTFNLLDQRQQSSCERQTYQYQSSGNGFGHSQRPSSSINSTSAYDQQYPSLPLSAPTDQLHQQASPYYRPSHNQQPHQSRVGTAGYPSPPSHHYPQPFQHSNNTAAYPLPSVRPYPPGFSNSPNVPYASQSLSGPPTPHGNQPGRGNEYNGRLARLATISGVVTPSKLAPGQTPIRPTDTRSRGKSPLNCLCSICGAAFAKNSHVKSHFVACEARNGNPKGARWNDGLRIGNANGGRPAGSKRKRNNARPALPVRRPNASEFQSSDSSPAPSAEPSELTKPGNGRLDAVNGFVFPSDLAAGELPRALRGHAGSDGPTKSFCPLCNGAFAREADVEAHFPTCVGRNGNLDGSRWDDSWLRTNLV